MKPFQFLKSCVEPAVGAYYAQRTIPLSATEEWPLWDCADTPRADEESVRKILGRAFDHTEAAGRGQAWILISHMSKNKIYNVILQRIMKSMMIKRFSADPSSVTPLLVDQWLSGVTILVERFQRRISTKEFLDNFIKCYAGDDLVIMKSSPEACVEFLNHSDRRRRLAAIRILLDTYLNRAVLFQKLSDLSIYDQDINVRIAAIRGYIDIAKELNIKRSLIFLSSIVIDDTIAISIRETAYEGLYEIEGVPALEWPVTRACQGKFLFPKDVDWDFVARCGDSR